MAIRTQHIDKNSNTSLKEIFLGCASALLAAIIMTAIPRFFHALFIPQVLQKNAYFIGKSPYMLVYLISVPAGLFLGSATYTASIWQNLHPKKAVNSLACVGWLGVVLSCYIFYEGFEITDPILQQDNLSYILAANVPWMAPVFLWSLFLLLWSLKIRNRRY